MNSIRIIIALWFALVAAAQSGGSPTNAYKIVFLKSKGERLGVAWVFSPPLVKADREEFTAKCSVELFPNKGNGEEVKWFKRLMPEGKNCEVGIETRKEDEFFGGPDGSGAHATIDFAPGWEDANVLVMLNLDKAEPRGTWWYSIAAGGWKGGKVEVSRVHAKAEAPTGQAEQPGAGQPATRPESKSEGGDKPQTKSEGRSR
jgi:hypothetical protein